MGKQVTVYTRTTCASCRMVKQYLAAKQHSYDEVNLDDHPDIASEVIARSGAMTVPIVRIHDETTDAERFAVGWNPGQLAAALA